MSAKILLLAVVVGAAAIVSAQEPAGPPAPPAGLALAGRVVAPGRRAIEGATISVIMDDWRARAAFAPFYEWNAEGRSDAAGRWSIAVPVAGEYHLVFAAPGFARAGGACWPETPMGDLTLPVGGGVRGRVVSRDTREPIAGALVKLSEPSWPAETSSDTEGRYSFLHVSPGSHVVWAVHRDHLPLASEEVEVEDGVVVERELQMDPGRTLGGTVVAPSGAPVAGARVRLSTRSGRTVGSDEDVRRAESDAEGNFVLRGVPGGDVTLHLRAAGHAPGRVSVDATALDTFGRITLSPGMTVRGTVRDPEDRPVAGAGIALLEGRMNLSDLGIEDLTTASDGAGRFELADLPAKEGFEKRTLRVRHASFADLYVELGSATGSGAEGLALRLTESAAIHGLLATSGGAPVSRARIELLECRVDQSFWPRRVAGSDGDGRFRFEKLPPGEYEVTARAPGKLVKKIPLKIEEGTPRLDVTVELREGRALGGVVMDASGKPVQAEIQVWNEQGSARAATDERGRFSTPAMDDGPWSVHVSADGYVDQAFENVTRGENGTIRLVVERAPRFSIRVVDAATGAPIAGAEVRIGEPDAYGLHTPTGEDGRLEKEVEETAFAISVSKAGYATARRRGEEVAAVPGRLPVEIALAPGGGIEGTLPDIPRGFFDGFDVLARRDGEPAFVRVGRADDRGRFRIDGLAPGTYEIAGVVPLGDDSVAEVLGTRRPDVRIPDVARDVVVRAGESAAVEFAFRKRFVELKVRCATPAAGTPVRPERDRAAPATLRVRALDGTILALVTDDGGGHAPSAELDLPVAIHHGVAYPRLALPPGRYRVTAAAEGLRAPETEIELRAGEPLCLRLRLEPDASGR